MSLINDSLTLCERELLIFKANIRVNLARTLLISVVYILLFTFIGGSTIINVPVTVVNYANNPGSLQFINSLELQQSLSVTQMPSQYQAMQMLRDGKISFVVVILPGFPSASPSVHVYYSNVQSSITSFALSTIEQRAGMFTLPGTYQDRFLTPQQYLSSEVVSTSVNVASGKYKDFVFPGIVAMIIIFSAIFSGITIITDRIGGSIKSFLVTPINKGAILISRILSGCVQTVIYLVIVLLVGMADGINVAMGWVGLLWVFAIGLLLSVSFTSIAAIVASRTKDVQSATLVSQLVVIWFWMLSGGIFSVLSLPIWLQEFSVLDPMTYATDGLRNVILLGSFPTNSIIIDFSALIISAIITTVLSLMAFKNKIE